MPSQTIRSYHPAAALRLAHWLLLVGFILSYCGLLPATPVPVAEAQTQTASFPVLESFKGATTDDSAWVFGEQTSNAANPTTLSNPSLLTAYISLDTPGDGWLRLTPISANYQGFAIYNRPFDTTYGIAAKFDYATYGGNGADGFSFFLFDGNTPINMTVNGVVNDVIIGANGGALGFTHRPTLPHNAFNRHGLVNGYVGIGFDDYGNFSSPCISTNCPKSQSIAIHGSGTKGVSPDEWYSGYSYLTHKQLSLAPFSLAPPNPKTTISTGGNGVTKEVGRANARKAQIIIIDNKITVKMNFGAGFKTVIDQYDLSNAPGQVARPSTFKMGFAGATAGSTNIHEVRNVYIQKPTDLSISQVGSPNLVGPGDPIQYTIVVDNKGPNDASKVNIADSFPASIENITWTCSATAGSDCGTSSGTGSPNLTTASLLKNGKITITVSGKVINNQNPGVSIRSTATVSLPADSDVTDIDDSNDSSMNLSISTKGTITLSNNRVNENAASGASVGNLSETIDEITSPIYEITDSIGDNNSFTIVGTNLKLKTIPYAYGVKNTYNIRIRVRDSVNGKSFEKPFIIFVDPMPGIIKHPKDQTIVTGGTATLSVEAVGPSLTYQWFTGNSGDTGTSIPSATSDTYDAPAGIYWVQVKSGSTTMDSFSATVSASAAPTILTGQQPTNQTINSGQRATLTVQGTGRPSPTYQWYQDATCQSNLLPGETSSTFITPLTPALSQDTTYCVRLANGVSPDATASAKVTVIQPPTIAPIDQLVDSAQTQAVELTASPALNASLGFSSYQWYQGAKGDVTTLVGTGNPLSLVASTLTAGNTYTYWVRGTNSYGTLDSEIATVRVHKAPTITTAPTDQTIPFGTKPTLTVAATGDVAPTYQWYKVVVENGVEKEVEVTGATSASFTPGDLTSDTTFRVKVTTTVNGVAKTVSSDSKITVTLPTITSDTTVKSGETAKLDVTLPTGANASDYTYQWYEVLPDGSEVLVTGATGASFTTPSLTSNKKYKAKVTGPTGTVEVGPTAVTVNQPPTVTTQTISNTLSDGKAPLSVAATPQVASDGPLTYQWYKLNADGITWDLVTGAAGASFEATAPGKYKAVVTTAKGVSKDSEVMTVNPGPPTITTQPTSTALGSNGPAPLSVGAALSPGSKDTLAYQWYKKDASGNWVKVEGATAADFNATVPGEYKAIVTADGASVESQVATVSPAPTATPTSTPTPSPTETSVPNNPLPPTIIDPPTDTQLGSKGQATLSVTAQLPSGSKGPLSYQWLTQDAQGSWITITGATAPTFSTQMPGVYKVVVTSADGAKVESKPATVNTPPVIATPPQPQTVSAGHPVTLTVVVTSTIPVTYTWYQINPDKTIKVVGTNSPTLTVQVTQTTSFSVSVRNNLGTVSTPPVTVMVKPVVADQVIPSGNTTTLGVPAQPDTSYQWYIVDPLTNQLTPIGGATSSTYNTPPLTQTTTFALKITPPTGEPVTIKLTVTVQPPPTTATATPVYPIARDDLAFAVPSVPRGIAVLGNDYDPNHSPLQIVGVGKPAHGVALLKGEFIFYTADSAFLGTDVFTYTISNGSLTATAKVTLTVTQENKNLTPLAYNYLFTTTQNIPITVTEVQVDSANILRNPDRDTQAVLTLWKPLHGKVWAEGQLIHYLPDLDFVGTDTFTYTLTDGDLRSLPGRITIVVLSPINIGGDAKVWKDDPFTRTAVISPSAGVPPWTGEVNYGDGTLTQTLKVNPDGTFRLTHTYTKSGVFTVTVALKDGTGKVTVKKFQVTVEPKPVIVAEKHFYYFPLMLGKDSKSSTSVQYRLYFPLLLKDVGPSKHQIHLALIIKQATPKTK